MPRMSTQLTIAAAASTLALAALAINAPGHHAAAAGDGTVLPAVAEVAAPWSLPVLPALLR